MVDKIILSDKEYEYLTKGIAAGVGVGTLVGLLFGNIILGFSAGGVLGIVSSLAYSSYKRVRLNNINKISL